MINKHVDEAVTLIGALDGPGVSKLTMVSAYHKLASSFLSSVSSVSFSPSVYVYVSVSPRYSVSASLLLTSSPSPSPSPSVTPSPSPSVTPSPSVYHCFSVSVLLTPSVSDFQFMCLVWCGVTCHIILILITHIRPTRQYEIQICAYYQNYSE